MKQYTVKWIEQVKTGEKNGNMWIMYKVTLTDEAGTDIEATTFDGLVNGTVVTGEVTQNGNYTNFKRVTPKQAASSNFKAQQVEKTMERKEKSIEKFQDSKEWSIKLASSMGKAIDLAIAQNKPEPETIKKWRLWILHNWDIDVTEIPPFN